MMRCSKNLMILAATLISLSSGCDRATSSHEPRTVYVFQSEPRLSDTSETEILSVGANAIPDQVSLVSNNGSKQSLTKQTKLQIPLNTSTATPTAEDSLSNQHGQPVHPDESQANVDSVRQPKEKFQPPFAERTNVFAPPNTNQTSQNRGVNETTSVLPVDDVLLKGFARVDDLRAILMIEDTITPLSIGQEKQGIRIISIEPPKVTLERGQDRWTLTLSNQFPNSGKSRQRRAD